MFGFGGQDSDDKNAEALFERFEINTSGRKYGEGGYGATFAAQDTKLGQPAAERLRG